MKRSIVAFVVLFFAAVMCIPAGAQDNAAGDSNNLHGVIPVTLAKGLNSKNLKEGDAVTAKTAVTMKFPNGLEVPKGTDVTGHVTEAKARSKGDSEASLGIMFDKIDVPGKALQMKGMVQAVGPNPSADSGPDTASVMGGNNMSAGNGSTASAGTGMNMKPGQQGPMTLTPKSTGVVGIKGLQLGENSVLTSSGKEVKLDAGSQIMIHAQ